MAANWVVQIKTCKEDIKAAVVKVASVKAAVAREATEVTRVAVATETVATTLVTEVVTEVTVVVVVLAAAVAEDLVVDQGQRFLVFPRAKLLKCSLIISASLISFPRKEKKFKLKSSFTWSILAFLIQAKMHALRLLEV